MGIHPFYEGGPCPSIKEQIARQFYARKDKTARRRPYRDQDGWGWTKISEASPVPALMSTRCGEGEVVIYTEYPPKAEGSDLMEKLEKIESRLNDIADALKDQVQTTLDVSTALKDTAEAVREIAVQAVTEKALEDVLRYTIMPVIVTDYGPAPKRPQEPKK